MNKRKLRISKKAPHPVDEKYGFADSLLYNIGLETQFSESYGTKFDRMRVGRIEDGRRYMGNGCWMGLRGQRGNSANRPS